MQKLFLIIFLVFMLGYSSAIFAQETFDSEPPPLTETELQALSQEVQTSAERAETSANQAAELLEEVKEQTDLALNLLGLFEAFGVVITVLAGVATAFGVTRLFSAQRELSEARQKVEEELEKSRERYEKNLAEKQAEFDRLRDELIREFSEQRDLTAKALLAQSLLPIGERQYRTQNYDGALDTYYRSLELDPKNPIIHYRIGYVHTHNNELEKAEEHYKKSLELETDFAPSLAGLGFVYRRIAEKMTEGIARETQMNLAEQILLKGLTLSPTLIDDDGESWWGVLGGLYRRRGQIEQAIYAYEQVIKVTPYSSYGFGNLALLYMQKNEREKMLKTYQRVERLAAAEAQADVDNYWGHADLVVSQLALKKFDEAEITLERTLEIAPSDATYAFDSLIDTMKRLSTVLEPDHAEAIQPFIQVVQEFKEKIEAKLQSETNVAEVIASLEN